MAEDASLERFLAAASSLRSCEGFDPVRALRLLSATGPDGDEALALPIDEALRVSAVAVAAPTARNAAIARYALERVAIAVERRLRSAAPRPDGPVDRLRDLESL